MCEGRPLREVEVAKFVEGRITVTKKNEAPPLSYILFYHFWTFPTYLPFYLNLECSGVLQIGIECYTTCERKISECSRIF